MNFLLKVANQRKIIGFYPQTKSGNFYEWYNGQQKNLIHYSLPIDDNADFYLELDARAKITDIIDRSSIPFGLVINETVKNILENSSIPKQNQFIKIKVKHLKKEYEYFWFHFIIDLCDYINFSKSVFKLYYPTTNEIKKLITFNNKLDFLKQRGNCQPYEIRNETLILNEDFPQLDIFYDNIFLKEFIFQKNYIKNLLKIKL